MDKKTLKILKREYAKTIVKHGINIKKNESVVVFAQLDQVDFVYIVVEECYRAGAKRVIVEWIDVNIERFNLKYQSLETIKEILPFEQSRYDYYLKNKMSSIYIDGCHVGAFNDIDTDKFNERFKVSTAIKKKYIDAENNFISWTIACVPSYDWAKKVFPNIDANDAINKLWEYIFKTCHISKNGSIKSWKSHDRQLKNRAKWLNSLDIASLHYSSKSGTDLTIETIPNATFCGGAHFNASSKKYYNPNFPTEEVFSAPHRLKTKGIVYSSKPIVYDGYIIDDVCFEFNEGKIINANAKVGNDVLQNILNRDQNAKYLGEFAFVPYDSPINNTSLLFYETMFDENASCHLALGDSFTNLHINHPNISQKQLFDEGFNKSDIHVDFMIGTKDLNIVATTRKGERVTILKNGNWVN